MSGTHSDDAIMIDEDIIDNPQWVSERNGEPWSSATHYPHDYNLNGHSTVGTVQCKGWGTFGHTNAAGFEEWYGKDRDTESPIIQPFHCSYCLDNKACKEEEHFLDTIDAKHRCHHRRSKCPFQGEDPKFRKCMREHQRWKCLFFYYNHKSMFRMFTMNARKRNEKGESLHINVIKCEGCQTDHEFEPMTVEKSQELRDRARRCGGDCCGKRAHLEDVVPFITFSDVGEHE